MLFLNFLWIFGVQEVLLHFIMPHLLLVTIREWDLMQLVIVVPMDNFTFTFNVIEDFTNDGANLMLGRAIIIWLKGMSVGGSQFVSLDKGWWN